MYVGLLISFPQVFSPGVKKLGVFVPAIYGLLVAAQFIATVGIWHFKQWGVQLYLLDFFAKVLFFMLTNQLGLSFYFSSLIALTFIVFQLRYYRQMNPNLWFFCGFHPFPAIFFKKFVPSKKNCISLSKNYTKRPLGPFTH